MIIDDYYSEFEAKVFDLVVLQDNSYRGYMYISLHQAKNYLRSIVVSSNNIDFESMAVEYVMYFFEKNGYVLHGTYTEQSRFEIQDILRKLRQEGLTEFKYMYVFELKLYVPKDMMFWYKLTI